MIRNEDEARAFVAERCDSDAFARLETLIRLLREENALQNLVSATSLEQVWLRHIADGAQLLDHVPRETSIGPWLDLGTGAGFPGLVIAAMRPQWPVILVESRRRRVEWLIRARDTLSLPNCAIEGVRLEMLDRRTVSVISARAFAPLPKLIGLAQRFSTIDTTWLLPKGRSAAQEVADLPRRMQSMFHVEPSRTDPDSGIVIGQGIESSSQ